MGKHVQLSAPEMADKPEVAHLPHSDDASLSATLTRNTNADTEKGSLHSHGGEGEAYRSGLKAAERRLLLKLDLGILPFAVLLYLSAYLDRSNL
jgi:hypothetical protein